MSKHTPGPWFVDDLGLDHFYETNHRWAIGVKHALISRLAKIEGEGTEYQANARLIAASPKLLHACKEAVVLYEQGCVDRGYKDERNWIDEVKDKLDEAIAAAEQEGA